MAKRSNHMQEVDTNRMIKRVERYPRPNPVPDDVVAMTGSRHDAADPVPVDALIPVTYQYSDVLQVQGEVVAWTPRAVLVKAVLQPGHSPSFIWVWANAVKRR